MKGIFVLLLSLGMLLPGSAMLCSGAELRACSHYSAYHLFDTRLIQLVGQDRFEQEFLPAYAEKGCGATLSDCIEYFQIPEDVFAQFVEEHDYYYFGSPEANGPGYQPDVLYCGDPAAVDAFYTRCTRHAWLYHFLPDELIAFAGEQVWADFVEEYGWGEEHNIVRFVAYAHIDQQTFTQLLGESGFLEEYVPTYSSPGYDPALIYSGTAEEIEGYYRNLSVPDTGR